MDAFTGIDIGAKLKAVRESRGLSQRELAARAGLTNGAISLIEQNKSSPSVASLKRLLDEIPMTLSEFFSDMERTGPPKYFYKSEEFVELAPQAFGLGEAASLGLSLRQLGPTAQHSLQVLHETYAPGADTGPEMLRHKGEEAGIVISGLIEVTVGGRSCVLEAGDGFMFDSRIPHRFHNPGTEVCVIVSVCTPPTF